MHIRDAARAVGRVQVHAHRVVRVGGDLVDEQLRAGQGRDGRRDVRLAGGAFPVIASESTPRSANASICGLNR